MSPATSAQVRRRQAARRHAVERQRRLNEERRQRDELELDLAADFAVSYEECAAAKDAVRTAEAAMGRVVDRMVGELRLRYSRVAQLLEVPEEELRRLRQLGTELAQHRLVTRGEARTSNSGTTNTGSTDSGTSSPGTGGGRAGGEAESRRDDAGKPGPGRSRRGPAVVEENPDRPAPSPEG